MSAPDEATQRQHQAADPAGSTWLSANAGSGKTRVLTDRVARLLLQGVPPQNILCLTYTKAAASEMQNRLFKRLGAWAMLPADALRAELAALGVTDIPELPRARTLFARAIEAPGGLKIQTIHAFCAAILRRFPLEAGVSPQFIEIDERAQRVLISDILEGLADDPAQRDLVDGLAHHYTGEDLDKLAAEIARHRAEFTPPQTKAQIWDHFGLPGNFTVQDLPANALTGVGKDWLDRVSAILRTQSATMVTLAEKLAALDPDQPDLAALQLLYRAFLYRKNGTYLASAKTHSVPTKKAVEALGPLADEMRAFMEQVADTRARELGLIAAEKSATLHAFAGAFLPRYETEKLRRGWLDFDDLILKTRALLTDPSVAEWVLFRLDGGTDHILGDEAQDTNPTQWQVIELLAREFASGQGARANTHRTMFVVGDRKQSIYSFQGADPSAFERMYDHFENRLGSGLQRLELRHSFRSSSAILRVVDTTFDGAAGHGLGQDTLHEAFHAELPGRVDLWPVVSNPEKPEDPAWYDPVDLPGAEDARLALARMIATEIRSLIAKKVSVPSENGKMRAIHAGDFLILLQRRSPLFHAIIRSCKSQGLDVAGVDRLKLGEELAVRDIKALLSFLATPEDDLALATALRSPLFGWSEDDLYGLAQDRGDAYLWQALRATNPESETRQMLDALRRDADYLRPYELIERILTRHKGRERLLGRLGVESQDGLDELLTQALSYERLDVPSLTGFLSWLDSGDVEVKRDLSGAGRAIRVMTVHGAKGLESPIVILPDTLREMRAGSDELLVTADAPPLWKQPKDAAPPVLRQVIEARTDADTAERKRLLYVAMTRAKNWLIVCGAGQRRPDGGTWYDLAETGIRAAGPAEFETPAGQGQRFETGDWSGVSDTEEHEPETVAAKLPPWIDDPAPLADRPPATLAPSDLGGAKALGGEFETTDADEDASLRRGRLVHLALEHLPGIPRDNWPTEGTALLRQSPDRPSEAECAEHLRHVTAALDSPALRAILSDDPLAEVPVTATLDALGGRRIHGTIDLLVVRADRILAVDYKSNRIVPANAETVPEGLLRQMGAYSAALAQIYPGKRIDTAIFWTETTELMPLSHDIVRAALQRTTLP